MKLSDLFAKEEPLKLNGEIVEGVFIREAPISELVKLQSIIKEKDIAKKLEMANALLEICVVDENGEYPFKDKKISFAYVMDIVTSVMEVNIPKSGK